MNEKLTKVLAQRGVDVVAGADAIGRAREAVEQGARHVLLQQGDAGDRPWRRAVVPVSGRRDADRTLAFAAGLAEDLGMEIIAAHVAVPGATGAGLDRAAHYADAAHHEYANRLEEFVQRALPQCSAAEQQTVREIVLARGDLAAELDKLVGAKQADLLIVEGGAFEVLAGSGHTLLVVKPAKRSRFRLKVGEWFA